MARVVPTALLARPGVSLKPGSFLAPAFASAHQSPVLPPVPESKTDSPPQLYELGLTTAAMGFHTAAIEAFRLCVAGAPGHPAAWRKLAELLRLANKDEEADAAEAAADLSIAAEGNWTDAGDDRTAAELETADDQLQEGFKSRSREEGMMALRERLVQDPRDVVAMRLLAQGEAATRDEITALRLLERALEICPQYIFARQTYAELLNSRRATAATVAQTARLVEYAPDNPYYRGLHAQALVNVGDVDDGLQIIAGLLRECPNEVRFWGSYAYALHFAGRRDECVQAHRRCLELQPDLGFAYWGLADLKDNFLTEDDVKAMRAQLARDDLEPDSRKCILYALGQTLERTGNFAESFAAYEQAVRLDCAILEEAARERADGVLRSAPGHAKPDSVVVSGDRDSGDEKARRHVYAKRLASRRKVFSRENFATRLEHAPLVDAADTPIFVVGLPRAGSTLVEQILSSHSQVEGTRELELIGEITRDLELSRMLVKPSAYPEIVLDLKPERLAALGARYIERSRAYRKTARSYFIDKRPWNWLEVGLIHLILPQAKIIDIRRKPMAACFAIFKQYLPDFSYDQDGLGWYYNNYKLMMDYWDSVLPGRVHFVQYERLVEDTETEIRRMLDYCGLPFEEGCLRFWETERVVATPSVEQVRRPIFRHALEQWRNFEPWLGPLKEALSHQLEEPA